MISTGQSEQNETAASSGAWISPDTLQVHAYFYETPFAFTYKFAFGKDEVTVARTSRLNIGPASKVVLTGKTK